ncbi:hypothetical protein [Pedobacter mucosus]|uniref:hypothetical protein n=1 Tax=Pedobacter mucosus TaxID=2895286 RepID=UPI001EE489A5|nr:hypothetical protein [Pedobacter mucosus]UKT63968.1 hypothetical protein LOK61_19630 [Pedobacter mucosus]
MFEEYKKLVVSHYRQGLASGKLSNNLMDPTAAKLKRECLKIYGERFLEGDRKILRDFFGQATVQDNFDSVISQIDVDRFRPLLNFLRQSTTETDSRNIELLAWLIDYNPRPFRFDSFKNIEKVSEAQPVAIFPERHISFIPSIVKFWQGSRYRRWSLIAFGAALLTLSLTYVVGIISKDHYPTQQCMYWSSDHYEPVDCNKKIFEKEIIALDSARLIHFKRITQPDTMTTYSINKVFYIKINDIPECFTGPGNHPVYRSKNLKPLSLYILRRYFGSR